LGKYKVFWQKRKIYLYLKGKWKFPQPASKLSLSLDHHFHTTIFLSDRCQGKLPLLAEKESRANNIS
jgi:hypothetical protein